MATKKKPAAKKTTKKRKPAAKKTTARKRKPAAKKPRARKTTAKKPRARKPAAKKGAKRKPAAKKKPAKVRGNALQRKAVRDYPRMGLKPCGKVCRPRVAHLASGEVGFSVNPDGRVYEIKQVGRVK